MMVCDSKAGDEQAKILHQELPTRGQEKTACLFLEILNKREQAESLSANMLNRMNQL